MRERYSGRHKYEIKVTNETLEARCNLPFGPKPNRIFTGLLMIGLAAWGIYPTWLKPDSLGYTNLWRLTHHYSVLDFPLLVIATALFGMFLLFGIRLFCPAGAILTCDRNQVTTTRIPWYSFTGHWVTRAYDALDVSGFRLKRFGSGAGGAVYGIRFFVNGNTKSVFRGSIEPPEAYRILLGLKSLGLDVPPDPELLSRVKMGLYDRKEEELDRRMRL
ncbi:MAG TPA: hypothetical protein VGI45_27860 [Terracidiphilus sp.]|jgi:hypothetical protein